MEVQRLARPSFDACQGPGSAPPNVQAAVTKALKGEGKPFSVALASMAEGPQATDSRLGIEMIILVTILQEAGDGERTQGYERRGAGSWVEIS